MLNMYQIILKLTLFPFVLLIFNGCSSYNCKDEKCISSDIRLVNNNVRDDCFVLDGIDTLFLEEYYCLWFISDENNYKKGDTNAFCVLSDKNLDSNIDLNMYERLNEGELYCINLNKMDSSIKVTLGPGSPLGNSFKILIDDKVFYDYGKIVAEVFFSNDIVGKYILKEKRKSR
jgi:hypothetical protein